MKTVLLIHFAATWFLVGLIWLVQVVHYPLFSSVGAANYTAYQTRHMNAITLIVGPVMLIELATAFLLALNPPAGVPGWVLWVGLGLVIVVWAVTAFINVPQHSALIAGFDADMHRALVASNWLRTLAWTLRGGLVLWLLSLLLR